MLSKTKAVRFALMADIHCDLIPDAEERLQAFIDCANEEQVDFIIQLGDFCFPVPENRSFLSIWERFAGPKYHVLGNHDMDVCDKRTIMDYLGMEHSYYSFDFGDYHFVVLDGNYIRVDGRDVDYENGNYFRYPNAINNISEDQLTWLEKDLAATNKPTILFSHQSLEEPHAGKNVGVRNSSELRRILREANEKSDFRKVVACMNGHNHVDGVKIFDDIYFMHINSMSYFYMHGDYRIVRYSEEITEKYPILGQSVPYRDPLYAIVTLEPGKLRVKGKESAFVGPSPQECGYGNVAAGHLLVPKITDRNLLF